ncbi:MAG: RnfABCDGE type electron transport complex subunit D [Ruminococcaceae bacterium]|nr:RnfABCDGE type electron transport complex subunit D [Oscillospiraceae bacterium]
MNTDYTKNPLTVTSPPHLKNPEKTSTIMLDVIIALLPATAWGVYVFGWRALSIILVSVFSAVFFEIVYQFFMNIPITVKDGSAVVTGLLLALCLPVSVPLWIPVAGSFFAIIIVKQLFGGIGKNIVNPAIAARVFLFLAWPEIMSYYTQPYTKLPLFKNVKIADAVASATPLSVLKNGKLPEDSTFDLIIGNVGGCIGEVSVILLLAGGVYLLVRKTINWHIPVSYIATVAVLSFLFPQVEATFSFVQYELISGGLILGAFFMATDYVTSPVTKWGRIIYGIGCGVITVAIRFYGQYAGAVSFAIMIMNLFVWYLDMYTRPSRFGGADKRK